MRGGWNDPWIQSSEDSKYIVKIDGNEGSNKILSQHGISLLILATLTIPESPETLLSTLVASLNPGDVTFTSKCKDMSSNCGWEDFISLNGNEIK